MPTSTKPYRGISSQRLVDMINTANGKQLQEGVDFRFGTPREVDGKGFNTRVRLHRLSDAYPSDVDIEYTRLPLSVIGELPERWTIRPNITAPFRVHDVLDEFNEAIGLDLTPEEVENTFFAENQPSYRLTISQNSLAWQPGSYYDVPMKDMWLDMVILQTTLDGLYPPNKLPVSA